MWSYALYDTANLFKHYYVVLQVFKECQTHDCSGNLYELSLVGCKCIGAYVRNKKNQNQVINLDSLPFDFLYYLCKTDRLKNMNVMIT